MNTHDKYELPPLPEWADATLQGGDRASLFAWAEAAIEADRKHFAELFMDLSRYAAGMYEQDHDPQMEGVSDGYWYAAEFLLGNKDAVKELEADRKRGGAPVAYRLLRKNADGEWVTDGRPWCDGVPDADLVKDSEKSGQYRIEYAFADPQPAEPVTYLDLGVGGYMDVGTALTDEQLAALPKGRHMLAIVGTYGVDGYTEAAPQHVEPESCFCDRMYPDSNPDASCGDCPTRDYGAKADEPVKVPSDAELEKAWDSFEAEMARHPTDDELEEFMAQFADEMGHIHSDQHAEAARAILARYGKGTP